LPITTPTTYSVSCWQQFGLGALPPTTNALESGLKNVPALGAPTKLIGQKPSTCSTDYSANPSSIYRAKWTISETDF
jgi:hypothetical protein